jgi:hypothetical protein
VTVSGEGLPTVRMTLVLAGRAGRAVATTVATLLG